MFNFQFNQFEMSRQAVSHYWDTQKRKSEHTCKQRCLLMPMVLEVGSVNSIVAVALPSFFQLHIIRRFMRLAVIFSRQLSSTHTGKQRYDCMPVWINPSKKSEGGREKDVMFGAKFMALPNAEWSTVCSLCTEYHFVFILEASDSFGCPDGCKKTQP